MWIFLSDTMLSVVEKPDDRKRGTLTVRARVAGDIEKVFPDAKVEADKGTDYRFRARIPRELFRRIRLWSCHIERARELLRLRRVRGTINAGRVSWRESSPRQSE